MLPEAKIYQVNKKPLNHVIVKREEDRMFQAFIESGLNSYSPGQLSFNWFIRDVEVSPFAISSERKLVERHSLTWNPPAGSLPSGLKLIEFEVTLSDATTARRDFGFIEVKEANIVAVISGGSEKLRSAKHAIVFSGSDSFDPFIDENRYFGMEFVWSCLDGGQLFQNILSGNKTVVVPSENFKKRAHACSKNNRFKSNGNTAALINPLPGAIYYIKLVVRKDQRKSEFLQSVYVAKEEVLNVIIR